MKLIKGILVWVLQTAATLAVFCALTMIIWLTGPWYAIASWGLMPILGLFSAYLATRGNVNNYVAWLAPPVCVFAAHSFITGYTPNGTGPTLLTALFAIIGAAAGMVQNSRKRKT